MLKSEHLTVCEECAVVCCADNPYDHFVYHSNGEGEEEIRRRVNKHAAQLEALRLETLEYVEREEKVVQSNWAESYTTYPNENMAECGCCSKRYFAALCYEITLLMEINHEKN